MPETIPDHSPRQWLVLLGGYAGLGSAAVLAINTAKRAGVLPATTLTQLIAPVGQVLGIFLILGLWWAMRRRGQPIHLAAAVSVVALSLLVGVEFVLNLVFPYVSVDIVAALRAGPLGIALLGSSVVFAVSAIALSLRIGRSAGTPRVALAGYAIGSCLVAARAFVSAGVLVAGLAILAASIAALGLWLLRRAA